MFGFIKEYYYSQLTMKKFQKRKLIFAPEIEQQVDCDALINRIKHRLQENGIVYLITHKKMIYGIAVIEYEKHMTSELIELYDIEFETIQKKKSKNNQIDKFLEKVSDKIIGIGEKLSFVSNEKKNIANIYVLKEFYLVEELQSNKKTIYHDFIEQLKATAAVSNLGVKVILWDDDIIIDKTIGRCGLSFVGICAFIGIVLCMIASFIYDVSLSLIFLLCITLTSLGFGYTTKQNKNSINKEKESCH